MKAGSNGSKQDLKKLNRLTIEELSQKHVLSPKALILAPKSNWEKNQSLLASVLSFLFLEINFVKII